MPVTRVAGALSSSAKPRVGQFLGQIGSGIGNPRVVPELLERLKSALGDRYAIEREAGRSGMVVNLPFQISRED